MASSLSLKNWCFYIYVALICLSISRCNADEVAGEAGKDVLCFNDNYMYSSCEDNYRLKAQGTIEVAPSATDEYCKGPCFEETMHVLLCIDNMLHGEFRFENGASVEDARNALQRGCSHTDKRGDFHDVTERPEGHHDNEHGNEQGNGEDGDEEHHHEEGDFYDHPGEFGYYDHGSKLDISTGRLMMMMMMMFVISGALLLLS